MSDLTLTKTRLRAGIWEGVLTGADITPAIEATHLGKPLKDVTVTQDPSSPDTWHVAIAVPQDLVSDGVQTVLITDRSGERLGSFALIAGDAMDDDIRAELDLLRAELDLLKRAFRRHCVDTMAPP